MKATVLAKPLTSTHLEKIAGQFDMPDLTLPFWGCRKKMPMHCIVRLEGEGNYTVFHFCRRESAYGIADAEKNGESVVAKSVCSTPQKSIINLLYLEGIHPDRQQLSVSLLNGDRIEVSRRKASRFIKQVKGFQQELMILDAKPTAPIIIVS